MRRVAVVTGGSGAIGAATCRALSKAGWLVVIGYASGNRARALADSLNAHGRVACPEPLDMTKPDEIENTLTRVATRLGHIDALVFNAGAAREAKFGDTSEADWELEVQVNFLGPVLMTRLVLPSMLQQGRGALIGVTSESAKIGNVGLAPYSATKAALSSFLRAIHFQYAGSGIRANCVAPGPIDTPMLRNTFPTAAVADVAIQKLTTLVPQRRLGRPQDVGEAIRFLCDDRIVTGEHLSVGGGVTMN